MRKLETEVVVIGGGATGAGVLRDLALRGIKAILVEQQDLVHGTSSRYHGLLHSGARYAVGDAETARESYEENLIVKRTVPGSVEDTGGFFVKVPQDDDAFVKKWLEGCKKAGIPIQEVPLEQAFLEEPSLSKNIQAAYHVPDGAVDGFTLVVDVTADAVRRGSKVLTYHQVEQMIMRENRVVGVIVRNVNTGEQIEIHANIVVNATGPWAARIAALAGSEVHMINNRGMLVVFHHRFNKKVINRLRKPGDADIFVPAHNVTIFGTTGVNVPEPDDFSLFREEVDKMLRDGKAMISDVEQMRIIRAFAGIRPLYQEKGAIGDSGRNVSRGMALLDHKTRDGIEGIITITGGKFTTFRYMAEKTVDLVCQKLGVSTKCTTAEEIVPHREAKEFFKEVNMAPAAKQKLSHWAGNRAEKIKKNLQEHDLLNIVVCECEQVTLGEIESVLPDGKFHLGDIRRRTRLGMGTCQGTFCNFRTAAIAVERSITTSEEANKALLDAVAERQKGMKVVATGETAKQLDLMNTIYHVSLGMGKKGEKAHV
ncbi:anaerobic glycerol-3-phosphate dehydrogenase subunit GlpA [Tepidibacillus sp. HK-1]|uniref:anaerobic glycerol-3-phosphate dehydrogenase subunit GlpA n=1 Tax=Tepidibacillus sp. HK-1 TaxID=1883407 RepID=UPI000853BF8B|nr:anaerobic glycerol-3-phosphate dehydrogenase subunit GlpA [Tepidibacillus sp. HK-1]GBF10444.1 anaerobic glycerol-3-phosphate dehydrogenase subunit A [Tepidibacillus sp. HK-1]